MNSYTQAPYEDWDDDIDMLSDWEPEPEPEPTWYELGVCCWDPRYDGPKGHCACKAEAEEYERAATLRYNFLTWLKRVQFRVQKSINRLFEKHYSKEDLPF